MVDASAPLDIQREDDTWMVEGPWLQQADGQRELRRLREPRCGSTRCCGTVRPLRASWKSMGIQDGDIVSLYDFEFEYQR